MHMHVVSSSARIAVGQALEVMSFVSAARPKLST
jgi:hypothetical protein